ncbi:hypothetical protein C0J52_21673 [Blattella germanica]|nr:hypothetical protein C0J52_21673 [Blattella germanica]
MVGKDMGHRDIRKFTLSGGKIVLSINLTTTGEYALADSPFSPSRQTCEGGQHLSHHADTHGTGQGDTSYSKNSRKLSNLWKS